MGELRGAFPAHRIETVSLDVGGTLVGIDFERVAGELARLGVSCSAERLRRGEAAARPRVSAALGRSEPRAPLDAFHDYLRAVLARAVEAPPDEDTSRALARALHAPGRSDRLWNQPLPGAREALAQLAALGLRLVAVSNSDGTVARNLEGLGLAGFFEAIVDSHVVGYEKPDPRIFAHALSVVDARPETTLHTGDLYTADVAGARRAGLHAVLIDPFDDWNDVDCPRAPDVHALATALAEARAPHRKTSRD